MADIAARREARRRRILENSESRLRKITSLHSDFQEDDKSKHNLNTANPTFLNNYTPLETDNDIGRGNEEITQLLNSIHLEKPINITPKNTTTKTKNGIIILIAILFKISFLICTKLHLLEEQCLYLNKIFIPFLVYEMVDIVVLKSSIRENSFLNTLLILTNIPPKLSQKVGQTINILGMLMQDMFFYFFIFLIMEVCIFLCLGV